MTLLQAVVLVDHAKTKLAQANGKAAWFKPAMPLPLGLAAMPANFFFTDQARRQTRPTPSCRNASGEVLPGIG
jgi:hypothetical protein